MIRILMIIAVTALFSFETFAGGGGSHGGDKDRGRDKDRAIHSDK